MPIKMTYEDKVKKYERLVREEEERIKLLTREVFRNKKGISSHPTSLTKTYDKTKYDKKQYEYLRQKYYRLKEIKKVTIEDRATSFLITDYITVVGKMVEYYNDTRITREWENVKRQLRSMNHDTAQQFLTSGFNKGVTEKYHEIENDLVEGTSDFTQGIIETIRIAEDRARRLK